MAQRTRRTVLCLTVLGLFLGLLLGAAEADPNGAPRRNQVGAGKKKLDPKQYGDFAQFLETSVRGKRT